MLPLMKYTVPDGPEPKGLGLSELQVQADQLAYMSVFDLPLDQMQDLLDTAYAHLALGNSFHYRNSLLDTIQMLEVFIHVRVALENFTKSVSVRDEAYPDSATMDACNSNQFQNSSITPDPRAWTTKPSECSS
ncbi:hypothetical protein EXS70_00685 [Candidatus Peribacteria bacterium]|nr:hypothetical protein [Candidatus Peribacteria bacterium]